MTRPPDESHPDCGKQMHLWTIVLKPGDRAHCRRCGKLKRGRKR